MSETKYTIFLGVTPGLEPLQGEELGELGFEVGPRDVRKGGHEIIVDRAGLWRLAWWSRLSESLRVRLGSFEAKNFGDLSKGLVRLPWVAYYPRGSAPRVEATARRSKLYHTDAVAERAAAAIANRLANGDVAAPDSPVPDGAVHLRLNEDQVTVSIDAAGERLHRRGYRKHVGKAPLRETLAAACIRAAGAEDGRVQDPFCGAGTIPIEAAAIGLRQPAPCGRDFAFTAWPTHDADAYAEFRERTLAEADACRADCTETLAMGSDRDGSEIEAAQANAEAAGLRRQIALDVADVADVAAGRPVLISNLPWGRRTERDATLARSYGDFEKLVGRARAVSPEARAVALAPQAAFARSSEDWRALAKLRIGGVPVVMWGLGIDR